jgi:hypothetical protein
MSPRCVSRAAALTLALIATLAGSLSAQTPLGTAFTYQGRLTEAGGAANGLYDLELKLYDASIGGTLVASLPPLEDVSVVNGLFTVTVDFGAGVFAGSRRWLATGVRAGSSTGAFTTFSERQELTATPNAVYATKAGDATTVAGLTCATGEVAKWSGTAWGCGSDDTVTESQIEGFISNDISTGNIPYDNGTKLVNSLIKQVSTTIQRQ